MTAAPPEDGTRPPSEECRLVVISRRINADPGPIFEILADPGGTLISTGPGCRGGP